MFGQLGSYMEHSAPSDASNKWCNPRYRLCPSSIGWLYPDISVSSDAQTWCWFNQVWCSVQPRTLKWMVCPMIWWKPRARLWNPLFLPSKVQLVFCVFFLKIGYPQVQWFIINVHLNWPRLKQWLVAKYVQFPIDGFIRIICSNYTSQYVYMYIPISPW